MLSDLVSGEFTDYMFPMEEQNSSQSGYTDNLITLACKTPLAGNSYHAHHVRGLFAFFARSFFLIKALSVQSDHCRAMGCGIGGDSGPGRNGHHPGAPIPIRI